MIRYFITISALLLLVYSLLGCDSNPVETELNTNIIDKQTIYYDCDPALSPKLEYGTKYELILYRNTEAFHWIIYVNNNPYYIKYSDFMKEIQLNAIVTAELYKIY